MLLAGKSFKLKSTKMCNFFLDLIAYLDTFGTSEYRVGV